MWCCGVVGVVLSGGLWCCDVECEVLCGTCGVVVWSVLCCLVGCGVVIVCTILDPISLLDLYGTKALFEIRFPLPSLSCALSRQLCRPLTPFCVQPFNSALKPFSHSRS